MKQCAYKNVNDLKSFDDTSLSCFRPATCPRAGQSDAPDQVLEDINVSTAQGICSSIIFGLFHFVLSYTASPSRVWTNKGTITKGNGRTVKLSAIQTFCL